MIVLGIDPGPETCGVVLYGMGRPYSGNALMPQEVRVWCAEKAFPVQRTIDSICEWMLDGPGGPFFRHNESVATGTPVDLIAIERMQSYGISGSSLLRTSEVVGRLWQHALEIPGAKVELVYRREVLKHLDVTGKGNRDSLVRQRLIEMHGGCKQVAVGTKKNPGPLHGVSGHAWSALAVAITAAARLESKEATV